MKRVIILLILSIVILSSFAQQRGASNFNTDDFPNISFIWNDYNPNIIQSDQVSLKEDNQLRTITWRNEVPLTSVKRHKSIVILWEDMRSHGEQSDFTSAMLRCFFYNGVEKNDYFNIIAFNRDNGDGNFMESITGGFLNDVSQIQDALYTRVNSMELFNTNPYSANIYQALNEAIGLLEKEPKENLKAIILISAGMNMNTAGAPKEFVSAEALKRNIPIYIVKYPFNGDYSRKDIEGIEKITFGELIVPNNTRDDSGTAQQLSKVYYNMSSRHYGQDYKVTFTSLHKRDGKTHDIILNINGIDYRFTYISPDFSLLIWMQENIALTIILCCVLLVFVFLIVFFCVRASRKRKAKELESIMRDAQLQEQQRKLQQNLEAERKVREGDAIAARRKMEAEQLENRQKELADIMHAKNLYPRLVFSIDGENKTEVITSPVIKIGRDASNDIVLNKPTVSRSHAVINFNGSGFEIQNISKTNKTIVNGQFIDKTALKGSDVIGIGEIVINFYI